MKAKVGFGQLGLVGVHPAQEAIGPQEAATAPQQAE